MRSRSPKSNQLFLPSQPCIYASLVKIHPPVQKIFRRKEATRTPTRTPTPTESAPKTICPPPSVGGFGSGDIKIHMFQSLSRYHILKALKYSNEEIIEDVKLCYADNQILCSSHRSETRDTHVELSSD